MSNNEIPHLKVSGNPYDIGFQIGEHFKRNMLAILEEFKTYKIHKKRYLEKRYHIQQMLSESKKLSSDIIEEIEGMAEGSNIEFLDLFIHNCMHLPYWSNCSTSILKQNDTIYIVHNEDAHPLLEKYAYFVFVKPEKPDFMSFFSHCYPGIVPGMSYGFNMAGIVQTCNSLPDPTKSVGIPRMFVGRTIYENARTISDAIDIIDNLKPRSGGANYNLASMNEKRVVSIETTGTDYAVIPIRERFFRANHYISEKFKHHPAASDHTLTRQSRGSELLPKVNQSTELLGMMWDNSIFLTMEGTNNDCQTNSTLMFKITDQIIHLKKHDGKKHIYSHVELSDFF